MSRNDAGFARILFSPRKWTRRQGVFFFFQRQRTAFRFSTEDWHCPLKMLFDARRSPNRDPKPPFARKSRFYLGNPERLRINERTEKVRSIPRPNRKWAFWFRAYCVDCRADRSKSLRVSIVSLLTKNVEKRRRFRVNFFSKPDSMPEISFQLKNFQFG